MVVIAHLTQAQAATVINAVLTIIQYTFGLAIVVILVYFMYNINSAIAWSGVTRTLHSSIWPVLLRTDSTSSGGSWTRISFLSNLSIVGAILVAIAGVVTPLGLSDGPYVQTESVSIGATYIPDVSPIGRATSPSEGFIYGRTCGALRSIPCPGNTLNTTEINERTIETFSSTSYGPFNMRFRRYYHGTHSDNSSMSEAIAGTLQSLILRGDIFAVEGLIVDLTKTPGIGLRNHTLPTLQRGGVWSEDILWLEPVSTCVNTNVTVDYREKNRYDLDFSSDYNLTDRGGFVNLTRDWPQVSQDGQNVNLYEHAYKGAVLSNRFTMRSYNNMTRNETYIGNTFPSKASSPKIGRLQALSLSALFDPNVYAIDPALYNAANSIDALCRGFAGGDIANISNIEVDCTLMLSPPHRVDGGDPRLPGDNTTWTQTIHVCAAATRARMQRIEFSFNGTSTLDSLHITRRNTNTPVLWAVDNTNLTLASISLFWGRVADSYENDTSLSTIRSEMFYLPASFWGGANDGNPSTMPTALLRSALTSLTLNDGTDYSAISNYALLVKWQSLIDDDPINGPTQIINMIWTDMMANNLVGTSSTTTLRAAPYVPSVDYDYRYGIPALLLVCIWLPLFLVASFILLSRGLKISYLRHLLNQTSIGRVLTGDSSIRASPLDPDGNLVGNGQSQPFRRFEMGNSYLNTKDWTKKFGQTPVAFGPADLVVESMSPDTPASKPEDAEQQPTTPHDVFRKKRTLSTSLGEYVQSGHSYSAVRPESP